MGEAEQPEVGQPSVGQSSAEQLSLRLVCGLLASAARLVPVPLLDDILRERALRLMVSRTLRAHHRTYGSGSVLPLCSDSRGCVEGCLLFGLTLPFKLITFPIRKVVVWVMAAKYLATDLSEAVLLGRAMDRVLVDGRLPQGAAKKALFEEAAMIRRAFDNAMGGTDTKLLQASLKAAVGSVRGLPRAALHALRRLRKTGEDADPTSGLSAADKDAVEKGTGKVQSALESPEVKAMIDAFEERFEENLELLTQRAGQ